MVNDSVYGLSLGILGDVGMAMELADLVDTGKIHINEQTVSDEANVPFGGMKDSGNGSRFGGAEANIEAFTETQWVTMRSSIADYPFCPATSTRPVDARSPTPRRHRCPQPFLPQPPPPPTRWAGGPPSSAGSPSPSKASTSSSSAQSSPSCWPLRPSDSPPRRPPSWPPSASSASDWVPWPSVPWSIGSDDGGRSSPASSASASSLSSWPSPRMSPCSPSSGSSPASPSAP